MSDILARICADKREHIAWALEFLKTDPVASQMDAVKNGRIVVLDAHSMDPSIRNVVGGRAGAYERTLADARNIAMEEMQEAAAKLGANAVIGVDVDYEVLGQDNGMLMVCVSGTAVQI